MLLPHDFQQRSKNAERSPLAYYHLFLRRRLESYLKITASLTIMSHYESFRQRCHTDSAYILASAYINVTTERQSKQALFMDRLYNSILESRRAQR